MYNIILMELAQKQLKKLDAQTQERITSVLERIKMRPYSHVVRLAGSPYYRARVGKYRIIMDIIDDKLLILVVELGHRENIYKPPL